MSMTLCLDIGSTALKAALIDTGERVYAFQSEELPKSAQLETLRECFFSLIVALMEKTPLDIDAIALCGNGPSLVVNPESKEAYCIYWYDQLHEHRELASHYLPLFLQISEKSRQNIDSLIPLPEYLCSLIGGAYKTVLPSKSYERYILSEAERRKYNVPDAFLRHFHPIHCEIGQLSHKAADKTALVAQTPIFCGGTDYLMNILGSTQHCIGDLTIRTGTRTVCNCIIDESQRSDLDGYVVLPYIGEKTYSAAIFLPSSLEKITKTLKATLEKAEYRFLYEYIFNEIKQRTGEELPRNSRRLSHDVLVICMQYLFFRYKLDILEAKTGMVFRRFHLSGEENYCNRYGALCALFLGRELVQCASSETALVGLHRLVALRENVYTFFAGAHQDNAATTDAPNSRAVEQVSRLYKLLYAHIANLEDLGAQ